MAKFFVCCISVFLYLHLFSVQAKQNDIPASVQLASHLQQLNEQVLSLQQLNQWQEALALTDQVLEQVPDHIPALMNKANILLSQRKPEQAETVLIQILSLDDRFAPAVYALAALAVERGEFISAVRLITGYRVKHPENIYARLLHGTILVLQAKRHNAEQIFADVVSLLETVDAQDGKTEQVLLLTGIVEYLNNRPDSARAALTEFVAKHGSHYAASRYLSLIEYRQDNALLAIKHINDALKLAPDESELYILASQYHEANQDKKQQLSLLQEANQRFSGHEIVEQHLATALVANRLFDEAFNLIKEREFESTRSLLILSYLQLDYDFIEEAGVNVQQLLSSEEIGAEVYLLAAEWQYKNGSISTAIDYLNKSLTIDPTFIAALTRLTELLLLQGQEQKATESFARLKAMAVYDENVIRLYVELKLKQQNIKEAQVLLRLINLADNDKANRILLDLYMRNHQFDDAQALLNAEHNRQSLEPNIILAQSRLAEMQGQLQAAKTSLQTLFAVVFDDARRLTTVAHKQMDLQDSSALDITINRIRQLNHGELDSYLAARLALGTSQADSALAIADQALSGDPQNSAWLEMKVHSLLALDQKVAAIALLGQLYQDEKRRPHLKLLTRLYLEQGYAGIVIDLLKEWIEGQPDDTWAVAQLSSLSARTGQVDAAIAVLEAYPGLKQRPLLLNNLAFYYIGRDLHKALELAKQAHQLAPHSPEVNDTLGWIYTKFNQPEVGITFLQQASEGDNQNADILFHLAYTLALLNSKEKARFWLESAIKLKPKHALIAEINSLID